MFRVVLGIKAERPDQVQHSVNCHGYQREKKAQTSYHFVTGETKRLFRAFIRVTKSHGRLQRDYPHALEASVSALFDCSLPGKLRTPHHNSGKYC